MARENLIDPRAHERLVRFIDEYQLQARFANSLAAINVSTPTPFDQVLWQQLASDVQSFIAFHEEYPFVVAPGLTGRPFTTPLRQAADDQPLTIDQGELAEHVGIFGRSGGGKTTLAQSFAHEAYRQGLSVVTIDGKDDARSFPVQYPHTIIIDKDTPIPLLEPPNWLTLPEARSLLVMPLKHTMWGGEGLQQVATESHQHTCKEHDHPSVTDWREEVRTLAKKGDTYMRRDRCEGLAQRLDRLIDQYPGLGTTKAGTGIPLETLCTRPVYFGFGQHTEIEDFITAWLLELRFSYNRANSIRALNTFVLLDESNLLVHDKTINEEAPLAATFPLLREFGISVCLTANNYRSVPGPIRSNLYLQVAMNLTDATEANDISKTFGLTDDQRLFLDRSLTRGTVILRLADRWKHPVLARFDPLTIDKNVTPQDWAAALARTNALARNVTAPQLALPPPRATAVTPSNTLIASNVIASNKLALNTSDEALLRSIAKHHVALTTECEGHPQVIARSKKRLLTLGLINEESITVRSGRGGQGKALGLTRDGYDWLGITPGGAGRGGLQHQFLVTRLARAIAQSAIEYTVREKRIDLVLTYRNEHHAYLKEIINGITEGESIAIEIEVTDPVKTAPVNARKNTDAGMSRTIIATLPKERDATLIALNALPKAVRERTTLTDVFTLLAIASNGGGL
ncbi:MAG: helicase HerA domain-containing protein [Thermoanaerobaculia bacterium]